MTDDDRKRLEEIRERERAATRGPWIAGDSDIVFRSGGAPICRIESAYITGYHRQADRHLIAHSRSDIPWLLEQLDAANKRAAEMVRQAYPHGHLDWLAAKIEKGGQA